MTTGVSLILSVLILSQLSQKVQPHIVVNHYRIDSMSAKQSFRVEPPSV